MKRLIERRNKRLSVKRQCELLGLSRSAFYYESRSESKENLELMRLMDKQYTETPFYGAERMQAHLRSLKYRVNIKRVRRLLRLMGQFAIYCKPNTSKPDKEHKIYPYLLRGVKIRHVNHVWSADITYIPMKRGFMYLVAVIDWYSRRVLSWRLSNSLDSSFCVEALKDALKHGKPEVFNTDQGSQFTSNEFTGMLENNEIQISMDGKGRALDNVFVERLWRTVKYENIYLHSYGNGIELYAGLKKYFEYYNRQRLHSSLNWQVPDDVYFNSGIRLCSKVS